MITDKTNAHDTRSCPPSSTPIPSQVLARDARSTIATPSPGPTPPAPPPPTPPLTEGHDGFVSVESKTIHPLNFFKISGVDVAAGTVPISSQRCPDMAVVLELRLETDASRGGAGAVFGRGMQSSRCCEVRKKVRSLSYIRAGISNARTTCGIRGTGL